MLMESSEYKHTEDTYIPTRTLYGALALYKNYLLYNILEDLAVYLCFTAEKSGSLKP